MQPSFWNERYAGDGYIYGTEPNGFLREHAGEIAPGRVLCLGDGEGRNGVFLARRGHHVTSVDQSVEGQRKARALAEREHVVRGLFETVQADLGAYQPEAGAFAGVVSIFLHLPPAIRATVHRRAAAALAPGGVLVLEAYTPAQLELGTGGPKDAAMLYDVDQLRADFDGLDLEVARELERDVSEGTAHSGHARVVQVVARRPR